LIIMKNGVAVAAGTTAEVRARSGPDGRLEDVFLDVTA
jgi:hypothetical protein